MSGSQACLGLPHAGWAGMGPLSGSGCFENRKWNQPGLVTQLIFFSKGQGGGIEEGGEGSYVGGWGQGCFAQLRCFCQQPRK